eukprot:1194045-Rhodomonas_salina.1
MCYAYARRSPVRITCATAVLHAGMLLGCRWRRLCGTERGHAATRRWIRRRCSRSRTTTSRSATRLRAPYALSGTDVAYVPTGRAGVSATARRSSPGTLPPYARATI